MNATSAVKFLLGLDIVKGGGTYLMGGGLILAGVVCTALMLVDPLTGGTWIAMGYGLIRARFPVTELQAKLDALEAAKKP